MRPKQWPKNLLVFAGYLFTIGQATGQGQHRIAGAELRVLLAFGIFCMVSSAVYIINDILDVERDRCHPKKCKRPIASGRLSVSIALIYAFCLASIGTGVSLWLDYGPSHPESGFHPSFSLLIAAYVVLTTAYSVKLKHMVIVDVLALAAGFVLRAVAGAVVIQVSISPWFLLCTTLLALFVGLAKRRHEIMILESGAGEHRKILEEYSPELLDQMMNITAAAALMAYSLYTFSAASNHTEHQRKYMMATIPFVIYGIFRYLYLVHKKNAGGQPEMVFLHDKPILINTILWASVVAVVLKFG